LGLPRFQPKARHNGDDIARIIQQAVASQCNTSEKAFTAAYDYRNQGGDLLYQVLRYDNPKRFGHRQPDGHGDWIYKGTHKRVIYRWCELLKYPSATAIICEGEKDANNVAALGLCSTTVASGKWTDDCVNALTGRP
jgi:putative DNA primase/helicase